MPDPEKPPVIVPVIVDPPSTAPATPPPAPKGMRWFLVSGAAALGLFLIVLGTVLVGAYLFSDKEHLHEKIVLFNTGSGLKYNHLFPVGNLPTLDHTDPNCLDALR